MALLRHVINYIFLACVILISSILVSCNKSPTLSEDQSELLKLSKELIENTQKGFAHIETKVYNQTLDKELVESVIGNPITKKILDRNIYLIDVNMDSLFDEGILQGLNKSLNKYQSVELGSLQLDLGALVGDDDIPEYIRNQSPPPPDSLVYSVLYLSTPIIYKSRAIILTRTTGGHTVGINFFIKKEGIWKQPWE